MLGIILPVYANEAFGNAEGQVNTLEENPIISSDRTCPPSMVPIINEAGCKEAARLNGIEYKQKESTGDEPICKESGGGIYFNSDGAQKGDFKILCGTKRCPASCVSNIRMRNLRFEGFAVCEEERECKYCEYCQLILQQLESEDEEDNEEDTYTRRQWNVDCELKTLQKRHPREQHQFIAELMATNSNHSTETMVVPPSKRIAVVLRGETFRGGANIQVLVPLTLFAHIRSESARLIALYNIELYSTC
jgi:hypothetical protein